MKVLGQDKPVSMVTTGKPAIKSKSKSRKSNGGASGAPKRLASPIEAYSNGPHRHQRLEEERREGQSSKIRPSSKGNLHLSSYSREVIGSLERLQNLKGSMAEAHVAGTQGFLSPRSIPSWSVLDQDANNDVPQNEAANRLPSRDGLESFSTQQPAGFLAPNKTIQKRGMRSLTNYNPAVQGGKDSTPSVGKLSSSKLPSDYKKQSEAITASRQGKKFTASTTVQKKLFVEGQ